MTHDTTHSPEPSHASTAATASHTSTAHTPTHTSRAEGHEGASGQGTGGATTAAPRIADKRAVAPLDGVAALRPSSEVLTDRDAACEAAAPPAEAGQPGGTTAKFTVTDMVTNTQAVCAGQEMPFPDLPMAQDGPGSPQSGSLGQRVGKSNERVDRPTFDRTKVGGLSPEDVRTRYGGATVLMNFPEAVNLTLDQNTIAKYPEGNHEVPVELADNQMLKNYGVTKVEDGEYKEPPATLHGFADKTAPRKDNKK